MTTIRPHRKGTAPTDGLESEPPPRSGRPLSPTILDRLTEAGLAILQSEDPSVLTIERVCQEARVSRATFYRRWKSINPVIAAMAARLLEPTNPRPIEGETVREILTRSAYNRALLLGDALAGALFRYIFSRAGHDADLRALIQDMDRRRNEALIALLEQARGQGHIHQDTHPEFVMHQLFGPIWHRTLLLQLPAEPEFIAAVVDTVYAAISTPE